MRDDFAVFILSHGRANNIYTLDTLKNQGYTGKYYFVLDNEDEMIDSYKDVFGVEHVIVFNKKDVENNFDCCDNFNNRNVVVYARNICYDLAKELNLTYFLELEDDYVRFEVREQENDKLMTYKILNLDAIFDAMIEYLEDTNALTVAFSQGGDMIGGVGGTMWKSKIKRKAMNSFFCKTSKPFTFIGRMNDDVNTYTTLGSRGELFFTIANIDLVQVPTQKNVGGNSEAYLEYGTYLKSFYSVMCMPSCVKISRMGEQHQRIHHIVEWENCVPKIISWRFKHE